MKNRPGRQTTEFLGRLNHIWRWSGNAYRWGQWLMRHGASDEAVLHLARRVACNKIQNPWSMREIAHVVTQNFNEQRHAQNSRQKETPREAAPELLCAIFKRAGMQ